MRFALARSGSRSPTQKGHSIDLVGLRDFTPPRAPQLALYAVSLLFLMCCYISPIARFTGRLRKLFPSEVLDRKLKRIDTTKKHLEANRVAGIIT